MQRELHHYINGAWQSGAGKPLISYNPATNEPIWHGGHATHNEVAMAVKSARDALAHWSAMDVQKRAHYLYSFAQSVEKNNLELTTLISQETGKPLWESATETAAVINKIKISIQAYEERCPQKYRKQGEIIEQLAYKPHGVVAVLGAFNFPAHLSNGHIVPALLAGNTIVYKPSELVPAVATWIMQQWEEANLPAGVLNCIQGDAVPAQLLLNSDIQGVYFTGSFATGLKIHQHFSDRPDVIVALEMGGNNPLVIDECNNLQAAVFHTIMSSMITAGQRCTCARRIIIPDNQYGDEFLQAFTNACKQLSIGCYDEKPEPFMGPVISPKHAQYAMSQQNQLLELNGKPLLEMQLIKKDKAFLSPGIIDMSKAHQLFDDEIFAPIVQIYKYHNFDEAITIANQTRYGLSAGLIGNNEKHHKQFYQKSRAGIINYNRPTTGASSTLPFGGIQASGNHRPSGYFAADYCAYPTASLEQAQLTMPSTMPPGLYLS